MNTPVNQNKTFHNHHHISLPHIASTISALLLSSCVHYSDEHQAATPTVQYRALPYRPLSELGNSSYNMLALDEPDTWKGLRDFLMSGPISSDEEFVGDDGTIYTREELESGNQ